MTSRTIISTAAAAALAVPALTAPAALASKDARIDGKYGYVEFQANGEIIRATDIYHDGYGVRAYLKWDGGKAQVTSYGKLYPVPRNLKIPENTTVYLRMCYTQNKKPFNCSDPKTAQA
jgi:hypothetical protein